jgi:hypothetical protein
MNRSIYNIRHYPPADWRNIAIALKIPRPNREKANRRRKLVLRPGFSNNRKRHKILGAIRFARCLIEM